MHARVARDDDQLGLARAQCLQDALVAQSDLSTLHDQSQTAVDGVRRLLDLLGGHCFGFVWEEKVGGCRCLAWRGLQQ